LSLVLPRDSSVISCDRGWNSLSRN